MKVIHDVFDGVFVIEPEKHIDSRGFFLETYEKEEYKAIGITEEFVQDNHSRSNRNVLRGVHFTKKRPQAQIVTVMRGRIYDVVVDIRKQSETFGKWFGVELSDNGVGQIYMPAGFAHGFCVLSEYADLHYKVSQYYDPEDNYGLIWNDQGVQIDWPIKDPLISSRDLTHPTLDEI